ncbi:hypothetical protein PILCRDRAFT_658484 [Piloderma croceum F 1598]|uniref:Uncharacterized protein n=1 Tax=Piloderma croceum (strain F 1598) TaxID=765440 RepID=A0A0C3EU88_PILCF|nr:hypothetical protein PILCRDRAFT_658484 [Piloderma croceum F 1598]
MGACITVYTFSVFRRKLTVVTKSLQPKTRLKSVSKTHHFAARIAPPVTVTIEAACCCMRVRSIFIRTNVWNILEQAFLPYQLRVIAVCMQGLLFLQLPSNPSTVSFLFFCHLSVRCAPVDHY